jgi:hypothetical protein
MKIDKSAQEAVRMAQKMSPELPWNCWDVDKLGPTTMKFMEEQEPFFARWAEIWYQNMQFVYGNQSLRWSRRYGYAVDSDFFRSAPAMNQRAQTNLMRTIAESLSALIYSNLPTWEVDAANQKSIKGKRFQKIVQNMLDSYMTRLCMDRELATAAMSYVVFGQMCAFVDWKDRAGEILQIPQWDKKQTPIFTDYMASNPITQGLLEIPTPVLDEQGQPRYEERWEPRLDGAGRQVTEQTITGDVGVDMLTPFEYRRQIGSSGAHKSKYWERIRLIDYDEFLDEYGDLEGRTSKWNSVRPVYTNPAIYRIAMRHFMRMQMTCPPSLGDVYQRPQSMYRSSMFRSKVLIVDHYDAPHPVKWPTGRRAVIVNGEAVIVGKPRYHTNKKDGWHPFVEAQWFNIAPSSMASGPITDSIQKNRELNVADSLQATSLRRNMGSQLLIKTGAGFDPQRMTGEPGMMHVVNDPMAFRWLHDDMPIPPVVAQLRQQIKDDVYETSGAQDAIRGDKTPGVGSGYQERQIQEREEKRLAPARKIFGYFVAGIGEKMWACLKQNVVNIDTSVMGYLQRCASGEYTPQDVVALLSSEIDFGVEINIKADSMAAKSKATDQATLLELLKGPAGVRAQNPKVLDEILKFFDVEHLRDESGAQRDRAGRENEVFQDMLRLGLDTEGLTRPVVIFEDDDDLHIAEHTDFMVQNTDEILKNPEFYREFLIHNEAHRLQKQEKEGQLMPGAAQQVPQMMGQVAPTPPPSTQAVAQDTMIKKQMQMQAGKPTAPTAPTQPTAPGQPKAADPNAPAQNTNQGKAAPQ